MSEELLDDPQVRPALEQVGREAVAQGVRRHAVTRRVPRWVTNTGLPGPSPSPALSSHAPLGQAR